MPFSREEILEVTRYLHATVRQLDPAVYELVVGITEPRENPSDYLLDFLRLLMKVYSERSAGSYGSILDRINHYVRAQDGGPVRGISIALLPEERERFGLEEFSLAELQDRSQFLAELERLIAAISGELHG